MTEELMVDVDTLREQVREKYREVAVEQDVNVAHADRPPLGVAGARRRATAPPP